MGGKTHAAEKLPKSLAEVSLFRLFAENRTGNETINNSPSRASSEFFLFAHGEIFPWYRLKHSFFWQLVNRAILMTPLPTTGCGRNSQLGPFDYDIVWQGESSRYAY